MTMIDVGGKGGRSMGTSVQDLKSRLHTIEWNAGIPQH